MKNQTPDSAVLQEIEKLARRIHELCVENNIPVVIGYSYAAGSDENGRITARVVAVYLDQKKGAFDSVISGAAMMLKQKNVPDRVLILLDNMARQWEEIRNASATVKDTITH
ncbi:hypothetical protein ACQYRI_08675 [Salmonella enterica]